jgi:hypothetical protein
LVAQGLQRLAPTRIADGMRRTMGRRRPTLQGRQPTRLEGLEGMADGLIVATERRGDAPGPLPTGTGQHELQRRQTKASADRQPA